MSSLPTISIATNNILYKKPFSGYMLYQYSPFYNLKNGDDLGALRIPIDKSGISVTEPLEIKAEEAYDGSINLIVNDRTNPIKMINSRFYLTDSTHYEIADRKGNLDTNIYNVDDFDTESCLIKTVRTIPHVDFLGISDGGNMKIGNYNFYFKLSDYDGNESDFVAESGNVVCYIGNVNQPQSIRGGQLEENSNKIIKFKLRNLDLAYNYINVYYTRSSGSTENQELESYKIANKFKITSIDTSLTITGFENHIKISNDEINIQYTNIDSAQTVTNCQNRTFVANTNKDYSLYETLEKYSLFITPEISYDENIGNLNYNYTERYPDTGYEYYNSNNIYYRLGYWEDIYRFGIVYIMNDYSLSPVFNIRGCLNLYDGYNWGISKTIDDDLNIDDYYNIDSTTQNSKGTIRILETDSSSNHVFNDYKPIVPIGLKFKFNGNIIEGTTLNQGLSEITKGFFIVRQKRIPTILCQGLGISTSSKSYIPTIYSKYINTSSKYTYGYLGESFLTTGTAPNDTSGSTYPMLKRSVFGISSVINNGLLAPEASIRSSVFNSFFNSSNYKLYSLNSIPSNSAFIDNSTTSTQYSLGDLKYNKKLSSYINSKLTLIDSEVDLTTNGTYKFSTKAGDASTAYKSTDPINGDYNDPENTTTDDSFNNSSTVVRGIFNSFIGTDQSLTPCNYYNIYLGDYDENNLSDYFQIRYNDSSPFMPISDRYEWSDITNDSTDSLYRGDCYINTVSYRMHWNFVDPELPTNKTVVDLLSWYKNYKIKTSESVIGTTSDSGSKKLTYRKLLDLFTYKHINEYTYSGETDDTTGTLGIPNGSTLIPGDRKYDKYKGYNGEYGATKINRPDVNAVPQGYWVTFKICSSVNLDLRDIDFTHPEEEAIQKKKRGFYPFQSMDKQNNQADSNEINSGISKTLGEKLYFEVPDVPFIKSNFNTRIYYSNVLQKSSFTNGNRLFEAVNFRDYTMEYGSIIKIIEWYGTLIVVLEHGIFKIPVNERIQAVENKQVYINTDNVLPENPQVLSGRYGSIWKDSIVKTDKYIYGIDSVAKKIWRTNGNGIELISDLKVQKFLNDNIKLNEFETDNIIGTSFIKTHYNAFKNDIIFTYYYNNKRWSLCFNEMLGKWTTQYTWLPEFSENINNIFYTFGNNNVHSNSSNYLWKHGFAGTDTADIKSTNWYGEQHYFDIEFIVNDKPGNHKIFDNIQIISNKTKPKQIFYEVVGEAYDWSKYKSTLITFDNNTDFLNYLKNNTSVYKIPYIMEDSFDIDDSSSFYYNSKQIALRKSDKTSEIFLNINQDLKDIKDVGILKGNMKYKEDLFDITVKPIEFRYTYNDNGSLRVTDKNQSRLRDKYIKIRLRYDGTDYAIINYINTIYTISYA